ncbi:protein pxr1-like [Limosa lapponica baueri]|uniref:Protein pxr1-like n=1 Tax=Limosa lapponica baueri TaxID=1758121 RepID=A0A2I0U9W2_LIMLA|nr:protein pxr1-like [Limosa lapponica baueri]
MHERNNSAGTEVNEEGEGEDAPGAEAEILLLPLEKTMVRQAVPLQPMEVNGGADIHLQPIEDPILELMNAPERGCNPMLEQAPGRTCEPMERGAHTGAG